MTTIYIKESRYIGGQKNILLRAASSQFTWQEKKVYNWSVFLMTALKAVVLWSRLLYNLDPLLAKSARDLWMHGCVDFVTVVCVVIICVIE